MQNKSLAKDYILRAGYRLSALQVLFDQGAWADVVRESQEVVELALKGLLRSVHIEIPRIHDVSEILINHAQLLPKKIIPHIEKLAEVSRTLRRDRELAFYGSEDLTPTEFYKKKDAKQAMEAANWVVNTVSGSV